jgi:hypothetical protein
MRLGRFSATPLFISNAFAGAALAAPLAYGIDLVLILIAMALVSIGGMYLDDVLGHQSPNATPDPARTAWGIPVALFAASLLLLAIVGVTSLIAGVVLIVAIVIYDAWHAGLVARSVLMGLIRVLVYVVAFSAFASSPSWPFVVWGAVMVVYVVGLTLIPRTVSRSGADRYGPLALVLLPAAIAIATDPVDVLVWSLSVAVVLWVAHSVSFAWRSSNRQVGGSVARLIAGISLVDAVVLATREEWWGALLAMICLALTMMFQRALRAA